jgi:hypothetical protein
VALVSADLEQLETVKSLLGLRNRIGVHTGRLGRVHRLQFGDRLFAQWLTAIGFTPRKTYTVGALAVPDEYFADFVRGHLDGDGSVIAYTDRYHAAANPRYVYLRLYVRFLSASRVHIDWLRRRIETLVGVGGYMASQRHRRSTVPTYGLHFAKSDSITLLRRGLGGRRPGNFLE